jgi:hypothetical protein
VLDGAVPGRFKPRDRRVRACAEPQAARASNPPPRRDECWLQRWLEWPIRSVNASSSGELFARSEDLPAPFHVNRVC